MTQPTQPAELRAAALAYIAQGWPVLPLRPRGKRPLLQGGQGYKDATTNRRQAWDWWSRYPAANIGVAPGPAGLFVVDVDPRHDGPATLAALELEHGPIPRTAVVQTWSGGQHIYLAHPGGQLREGEAVLGPGLDVKADRGYVVAPPSWVVDPQGQPGLPGAVYRWLQGRPEVEAAPDWLVERLRPAPTAPRVVPEPMRPPSGRRREAYWRAALAGEVREVEATPAGQRRQRLGEAAAKLARLVDSHGADLEEIRSTLKATGRRVGLGPAESDLAVDEGLAQPDLHWRDELEDELAELRRTPEGRRRKQLLRAALKLGRLVVNHGADETEIAARLKVAGESIGLDPRETARTVEDGLSYSREHSRREGS